MRYLLALALAILVALKLVIAADCGGSWRCVASEEAGAPTSF